MKRSILILLIFCFPFSQITAQTYYLDGEEVSAKNVSLAKLVEGADIKLQQGDEDGAVEDYYRALKLYNKKTASEIHIYDYEIHKVLAEIYLRQKKKDEALREIDRAISRLPKYDPESLFNRAQLRMEYHRLRSQIHLISEDTEAALADLNKGIAYYPENAQNYLDRAHILAMKGKLKEALLDYDRTVELEPNYPGPWFYRGSFKAQTGDLQGALNDLNRAAEIEPGMPEVLFMRAEIGINLKKYKLALADLDKFIAMIPDHGAGYFNRGVAHAYLNELSAACKDFEKAGELGVDVADAKKQLGGCH